MVPLAVVPLHRIRWCHWYHGTELKIRTEGNVTTVQSHCIVYKIIILMEVFLQCKTLSEDYSEHIRNIVIHTHTHTHTHTHRGIRTHNYTTVHSFIHSQLKVIDNKHWIFINLCLKFCCCLFCFWGLCFLFSNFGSLCQCSPFLWEYFNMNLSIKRSNLELEILCTGKHKGCSKLWVKYCCTSYYLQKSQLSAEIIAL